MAAQLPNETVMLEIEVNSLARLYHKDLMDLNKDPRNFKNFKNLQFAEYNARMLALAYVEHYKKNNMPLNPDMKKRLTPFTNGNMHDVVKENSNAKRLQNVCHVDTLIRTIKESNDLAFLLAGYLREYRSAERFKDSKESQSHILNNTQTTIRKQDEASTKLQEMSEKIDNISARLENLGQTENPIQRREQIIQQQNAPIQVRREPEACVWLVPQEKCQRLFQKYPTFELFLKPFLLEPELFTAAELLLQLSEIPLQKQKEAENILHHYFPHEQQVHKKLMETMRTIRNRNRQNVYQKISSTKGMGMKESGEVFYYKLPSSDRMNCYTDSKLTTGTRLLGTKRVGNFKVPNWNFEYILLVEKPSKKAEFRKLLPDGTVIELPN